MRATYIDDLSDMQGSGPLLRFFCYDQESIVEVQQYDQNWSTRTYEDEIDRCGFYYHDIEVE